jgi:hypothetical protein
MGIEKFISELLYKYECVTIPEFGAFLTRSRKAFVSNQGEFKPPIKEVVFNSLLTSNDGILANHIAQKHSYSYEFSLRLLEKEVVKLKKRLTTQSVFFSEIGEMRLNNSRKIEFFPLNKINFNKNSFGLSSFEKIPLTKTFSTQSKIISIMSDSNNEDLLFTPENKNNKNNYIKYAAIAIISITLLGFTYYFSNDYIQTQKIKEIAIAQEKIKSNVQKATFNLGELSQVKLEVKSILSPNSQVSLSNDPYYSVIAGSYRSINNAEKKLAQLIEEGYKAEITQNNTEGLHRVAFGRFNSKKKALNLLVFVKYTLEEDAWFLTE